MQSTRARRAAGTGRAALAGLVAVLAALAALGPAAGARGSGRVPIKINEPTGTAQYTPPAWSATPAVHTPPTPHRDPGPLSGPTHLYGLAQSCYSYTDEQYRYELCPFRNVTQRDKSLAAGSLHVIMGVWREYEVEGGRYEAMLFDDGTACGGGTRRSTRVSLKCGSRVSLAHVTEPQPCVYHVEFTTPQACGHLLSMFGPPREGYVVADVADGDGAPDGPARVVVVPSPDGAATNDQLRAELQRVRACLEKQRAAGVAGSTGLCMPRLVGGGDSAPASSSGTPPDLKASGGSGGTGSTSPGQEHPAPRSGRSTRRAPDATVLERRGDSVDGSAAPGAP